MKQFSVFGFIGAICTMAVILYFIFAFDTLLQGTEERGDKLASALYGFINRHPDVIAFFVFFAFIGLCIAGLKAASGGGGKKHD